MQEQQVTKERAVSGVAAPAVEAGRRRRWTRWAAGGAVVVLVGGGALVRDVARIDPTSGGYESPYTDVRGEPIDWSAMRVTDTGFRDDGGWLLNTSLDCTTGQLRGHVGPFTFDYRKLSERAIVVHQPQEACEAAGFSPEWSEPAGSAAGDR